MGKPKSNTKLIFALIAVLAAIVIMGAIILQSRTESSIADVHRQETAHETEAVASNNGALDSKEYKAAKEYRKYLDTLTDEERDQLIENVDDAVYDAPDQVKKICRKYGLKYSVKSRELSSYSDVEKALKEKKLQDLFHVGMAGALKTSADQYGGGYILNKGNLYLEIEKEEKQEIAFITMEIVPQGVFPWQEDFFETVSGEESSIMEFSYEVGKGETLSCAVEGWKGAAFGKSGKYYIHFTVSMSPSDENEQKDEDIRLTPKQMKQYLNEINFEKFM